MAANMMYTAIAGLDTFSDALSVVSDNIANANTTGWKSNTVDFGDLVSGLLPTDSVNTTAQGVGSQVRGVTADWSTGNEIQTGNSLDVMIQGSGFFCVQDNTGGTTTGPTYYTRDGSFELDESGNLTDLNGNQVLDTSGKAINLTDQSTGAPYASYTIDSSGNIYGTDSSGTTTTSPLDTIRVATFNNPNGLVRDGNNLYTANTVSGGANNTTAGTNGAGTIISGALENSNVDLTTQMVNLIDYQADYQANSKSIATGSTLLQTVVGLIPE
jgi:flagellar hook protein FlgE